MADLFCFISFATTDTYAESFLEKINISLGPSPIEMLKFLHFNDDT